MQRLLFVLAVCLLSAMPLARAADVDPADLAFWQSIQNSTNPAEYQAYLSAFPNGKFAVLAKIRVAAPPAAAPAGPAAAPGASSAADAATAALQGAAPDTAPAGDVGQGEKIVLAPANLRVGQQATVTCQDFPTPTSYDMLVVVPAGSANIDPNSAAGAGIKQLWYTYASSCSTSQMKIGPFAPGKYEIRFMTRLYNNDGRQEISTRTAFTVR